ncbi:hypothetical protein D6745_05570 [Candidatus Woesearchaeota archaeon]|nr:MAG: hypothetical protein D6745_05570 [Candidatus Woesearchaeota archaeon]
MRSMKSIDSQIRHLLEQKEEILEKVLDKYVKNAVEKSREIIVLLRQIIFQNRNSKLGEIKGRIKEVLDALDKIIPELPEGPSKEMIEKDRDKWNKNYEYVEDVMSGKERPDLNDLKVGLERNFTRLGRDLVELAKKLADRLEREKDLLWSEQQEF